MEEIILREGCVGSCEVCAYEVLIGREQMGTQFCLSLLRAVCAAATVLGRTCRVGFLFVTDFIG